MRKETLQRREVVDAHRDAVLVLHPARLRADVILDVLRVAFADGRYNPKELRGLEDAWVKPQTFLAAHSQRGGKTKVFFVPEVVMASVYRPAWMLLKT